MKQTIIFIVFLCVSSVASAQLRMTPEVKKNMISPTEALVNGRLFDVDTVQQPPSGWESRLKTDSEAIKYEMHIIDAAIPTAPTATRYFPTDPSEGPFFNNPPDTLKSVTKYHLVRKREHLMSNLYLLRSRE